MMTRIRITTCKLISLLAALALCSAMTVEDGPFVAVLGPDEEYCIAAKSPTEGSKLKLKKCKGKKDKRQLFVLDARRWTLAADQSLCVTDKGPGKTLRLEKCVGAGDVRLKQRWYTGGMIRTYENRDCMRYSTTSPEVGASIKTDAKCDPWDDSEGEFYFAAPSYLVEDDGSVHIVPEKCQNCGIYDDEGETDKIVVRKRTFARERWCSNGSWQIEDVKDVDGGIRIKQWNYCLTVTEDWWCGGFDGDLSVGELKICDDKNDKQVFTYNENGNKEIRSTWGDGDLCLEDGDEVDCAVGNAIPLVKCDGSKRQKWTFIPKACF
mmetsp:Transcript_29445/g.59709  ORF Transcript_29445/g.59709 Transcript_29445/m.59709 type:complete len:322 (+) Transcript_29445:244-1209(+)